VIESQGKEMRELLSYRKVISRSYTSHIQRKPVLILVARMMGIAER
jgi:hypothetical protein